MYLKRMKEQCEMAIVVAQDWVCVTLLIASIQRLNRRMADS